ncbi:MAG TPA: Stp1/IreP family PP2C-type Ser/Thr phosphatase, partial [Clostridia bacterium]|nr:Stp1/IreP family PP2C-type Ser/Thr phosphatase [Clostridia bacterium]
KLRKTNQDDFACGMFPDGGVWAAVCDGMGGASGGSVASSVAVKVISEKITGGYKGQDSDGIKDLLFESIAAANTAVFQKAQEVPELSGMGTTVVAGIAAPSTGKLHIVHAGDSRAYLIASDSIRQITRDHSIVQDMLDTGKLTPEEAKTHPQKNIITRALGVEENLDIDYSEADFNEDGTVLICTDGLTNHVDTDAIAEVVNNTDYEQCPARLIDLANQSGGSDNITVVVMNNCLNRE